MGTEVSLERCVWAAPPKGVPWGTGNLPGKGAYLLIKQVPTDAKCQQPLRATACAPILFLPCFRGIVPEPPASHAPCRCSSASISRQPLRCAETAHGQPAELNEGIAGQQQDAAHPGSAWDADKPGIYGQHIQGKREPEPGSWVGVRIPLTDKTGSLRPCPGPAGCSSKPRASEWR